MKTITKTDVEAYILGIIQDADRRAEIENARETDPFVRREFDLWDTESEDEIPEIFLKQGQELADQYLTEEWNDRLKKLFEAHPQGPIPASWGDIRLDYLRAMPGVQVVSTYIADAQGYEDKSENVQDHYAKIGEDEIVNNTIEIARTVSEVPYGIVRIIALLNNQLVASTVRVMEFNAIDRVWSLSLPIVAIFGTQIPIGQHAFYIVPASQNSKSQFPKKVIAKILETVDPSWLDERACVESFLDLLDTE